MAGMKRTEQQSPTSNGTNKFTTTVESRLFNEVKKLAESRGTTFRMVVESALGREVQEDATQRNVQMLEGLLRTVLEDRLQQVEYGLRRLIAVVGLESLRTQFILLNFLVDAGVPAEKVDAWRESGHEYAVRQLKSRTKQKAEDL
jgi:hypothetical protein